MITTVKEFISVVAEKSNQTQKTVNEVYDAIVDTIIESANSADETSTILPSLGKFIVKPTEARMAKNPRTGEVVEVKAARRIRLKVSGKLNDIIKENATVETKAPAKKATKETKTPVKKAVKKVTKKK